jgi:hypothetical protein
MTMLGAETVTLADADRAYMEGLAAYDQAMVEDVLKHTDLVRDYLREARYQLGRARTMLERLRAASRDDSDIIERLVAVDRAGRPCCGKPSLWTRYPDEKTPARHRSSDPAAP